MVAKSLSTLLQLAVLQAGANALALVEGERRWTYAQMLQAVKQLALTLKHKGVVAGNKVGLLFLNSPECWLSFWALRWLGAVPVPLNLSLPPEDLLYVLQDAGVTGLLAETELVGQLVQKVGVEALGGLPFWVLLSEPSETFPLSMLPTLASTQAEAAASNPELALLCSEKGLTEAVCNTVCPPAPVERNELALLLYTSGTTSKPKGVMLSEGNILSNMEGFSSHIGLVEGQHRMLLGLPLFHAYGLICALYALKLLSPLVLVPRFHPKRMMQEVVAHQISVLPLVPSMFALVTAIANQLPKEALASLQVCISGGAALSPKVLKQAEETLNAVVLEGYGLTETSPVIAVNTPKLGSQPGSVGPVLANVGLRLTNAEGEVLAVTPGQASEEGEIEVQGPNVMLGYYNLPEATTEVLCSEGWFKTGDLGHLDARGNLVISGGRKKEIIIKAGENISPLRLEQALGEHPAIADLAVLGLPDERLGERVCACVIPKEGVEPSTLEASLKAFAREVLPAFLQPDEWLLAEDFPRTATGKLLRRQLKEQLLASRLPV